MLEKECENEAGKLYPFELDITNQESIDKAYDFVTNHLPFCFGEQQGLDALVNNAGECFLDIPVCVHFQNLLSENRYTGVFSNVDSVYINSICMKACMKQFYHDVLPSFLLRFTLIMIYECPMQIFEKTKCKHDVDIL